MRESRQKDIAKFLEHAKIEHGQYQVGKLWWDRAQGLSKMKNHSFITWSSLISEV